MELAQLLLGGIATGCVYGLVALGFVLIYKATEAVNFAQGDLMMLGAFITLQFVNPGLLGLPFWLGLALAIDRHGRSSATLMEALVIRKLFGQPQFAVVILTIARRFRAALRRRRHLGSRAADAGDAVRRQRTCRFRPRHRFDEIFVIAATTVLTVGLYLFFARTRLGMAMQASSQNQLGGLLHGRSGQAHPWSDLGAFRRHFDRSPA